MQLTKNGKKLVKDYISELKAKRKEILDAGIDTADTSYSSPTSVIVLVTRRVPSSSFSLVSESPRTVNPKLIFVV